MRRLIPLPRAQAVVPAYQPNNRPQAGFYGGAANALRLCAGPDVLAGKSVRSADEIITRAAREVE